MYVTRAEATVMAGQGTAYVERVKRLGVLMKSQEGFAEMMVLNSFGHPAKYAILNTWKSREAARAFALSHEVTAFMGQNPLAAVATQNRPMEAYETILDVTASGEPGSINILDVALDVRPGNAAAFEASRKELFELRKKHQPGFLSERLLRFLGAPNRYLVVWQSTNREALPAPQPVPETQAYTAAHPLTEFSSSPQVAKRYEVIQRI